MNRLWKEIKARMLIAKFGEGTIRENSDIMHNLLSLGASAVNPLIDALSNKNDRIVKECVRALGHIGDKKAVPALERMLEHSDEDLRQAAEKALKKLHSSDKAKTKSQLIEELVKMRANLEEFKEKAEALERMRDLRKEDQYKYILPVDHSPDIVCSIGVNGTIAHVSPCVEEYLGYSPSELVGKSAEYLPFIPLKSREALHVDVANLMAGQTVEARVGEFVSKRGTRRFIELSGRPFMHNGQISGYVVIGRDVTERQMREDAVREQLRFQEMILQSSMEGFAVFDVVGQFKQVNPALCAIVGYSGKELLGMNIKDLESDRTNEATAGHIATAIQLGYDRMETELHRNDGNIVWAEMSTTSHTIKDNRFLVSHWHDITNRKREEERLRLCSDLLEQCTTGVAMSDLSGRLIFINEAFAQMHGYSAEELKGQHLSVLHTPDQLDAVEKANRELMEKGIFTGRIWHTKRDKSAFQGFMKNSLLYDQEGKPAGMVATLFDMAEAPFD